MPFFALSVIFLQQYRTMLVKLRILFERLIKLFMRDPVQNAVLQRLYRLLGRFLVEKTLNSDKYISFPHKPGGIFLLFEMYNTPYKTFLNKINVLGDIAFLQDDFLSFDNPFF